MRAYFFKIFFLLLKSRISSVTDCFSYKYKSFAKQKRANEVDTRICFLHMEDTLILVLIYNTMFIVHNSGLSFTPTICCSYSAFS